MSLEQESKLTDCHDESRNEAELGLAQVEVQQQRDLGDDEANDHADDNQTSFKGDRARGSHTYITRMSTTQDSTRAVP